MLFSIVYIRLTDYPKNTHSDEFPFSLVANFVLAMLSFIEMTLKIEQ